jgi:hypothetical protein
VPCNSVMYTWKCFFKVCCLITKNSIQTCQNYNKNTNFVNNQRNKNWSTKVPFLLIIFTSIKKNKNTQYRQRWEKVILIPLPINNMAAATKILNVCTLWPSNSTTSGLSKLQR